MTTRELIEIINDYDVKIAFDKPEDVIKGLMQGIATPISFTPVEGLERKKYEKSNNKSDFVSTSECIHIPELELSYLIEMFKCTGTNIYDMSLQLIAPHIKNRVSDEIEFVIFTFLHEVGHWKQFTNMSRLVEKFVNMDEELHKDNFIKQQMVLDQRQIRMDKGNNCPLTAKEKKALNQLFLEYRQIPKEKDADNFAFQHINIALDKYRTFISS